MLVHCYFTNGFMLLPLNTSLIKISKLISLIQSKKKNDEFDVIILYEIIIKHHVSFYGK